MLLPLMASSEIRLEWWLGVRAWMVWFHGLKEFELYLVGSGEPV